MQGATAPLKVFGSMRFSRRDGALPKARLLQAALAKCGLDLVIVEVPVGASIEEICFDVEMPQCVAFIAMGAKNYVDDTGNQACTYYEIKRWSETFAPVWGPIIPIRCIGKNDTFNSANIAKDVVFKSDALALEWDDDKADEIATKIAALVFERVRNASLREKRCIWPKLELGSNV